MPEIDIGKERKALLEIPEEIEINGKKFRIDPLSQYKLELVGDLLSDVLPMIATLGDWEDKDLIKIPGMIKDGNNAVAKVFEILTIPNGDWEKKVDPDFSEEHLDLIKRNLNSENIIELIKIVRKSLQFEELLKNVFHQLSLWKTSAGEKLSPGSSNAPVGGSTILPAESALEV
jgi:hypothetical protein